MPRYILLKMSAKESVLQAIHRLPENADYHAIAEEIAFLAALEKGDQDIQAGRVVSNEDARKKLEELYPVLVQLERFSSGSKRTRVLNVIRDEDDWPKK